jgi:hypothetical protein
MGAEYLSFASFFSKKRFFRGKNFFEKLTKEKKEDIPIP